MALNGSMDDSSPAGALRVLSGTGRTGAIRFNGVAPCTAYLCEGQLYFVRGEETDSALASALVRPGRLTAEQWTAAVDEAGDAPRVGEVLIDHGAIDPDLLASVVLSVIYDPLISLFRSNDGRFDFEPDTMHWIGPARGFNVEAIVNEVRRRVERVEAMADVVPSLGAWVSPRRTLPDGAAQVTLLREDWEMITALSGPRTVKELAGAMGRGQYSTAQVVDRLTRAGLLDVVDSPEPVQDPAPGWEAEPAQADQSPAAYDAGGYQQPAAYEQQPVAEPPPDTHEAPAADSDQAGFDAPSYEQPAAFDTTGYQAPATETEEPAAAAPAGDWESWGSGNPFIHPVEEQPEVGFAHVSHDGAIGPEADPGDESQFLPRRANVREADPDQWVLDDTQAAGIAEPPAAGLSGISGFHDPVADLKGENAALAEAIAPDRDPNAAWLENLYAQFIDDTGDTGKHRRKEALDVAFQAHEQSTSEKTSTLRRLVDALRRL